MVLRCSSSRQTAKEKSVFKKQKRCVQTRKETQCSWRVGRPWQHIEKPGLLPWGGHGILIFLRSSRDRGLSAIVSFLMMTENGL